MNKPNEVIKTDEVTAVEYDFEVCPACGSSNLLIDDEIVECLSCGATFS